MEDIVIVINALKWPAALIAIVFFLVVKLKSSIEFLVRGIKSVKYGQISAEVGPNVQDNEKTTLVSTGREETDILTDKELYSFSSDIIERAKTILEGDLKINSLQDQTAKLDRLYKYCQALLIHRMYERLYNSIYGSQLYILDALNTYGTARKDVFKPFFDSAVARHPDFYGTYSYDDYFDFLVRMELVSESKGVYRITNIGRDFLKFIIETNKTINKEY